MFYGEYDHTIDRKGRVIIPAKFRQTFKDQQIERLYLTRGLDECLFLFAESEWRALEAKLKHIPFTKAEGRKFNRLFFSGASDVQPAGLGRVLIPKHLKEFAHLKEDVVVVGVSTRIEIWAKEQWRAFYEASRQGYEDVAERVLLE